jgi:hypothetical protein
MAFADKPTASRDLVNKQLSPSRTQMEKGRNTSPYWQSLVFLSKVSYRVISKEEIHWDNRHGYNFSAVFSQGNGLVSSHHTKVLCSPASFRVECQDHTLDAFSIFPHLKSLFLDPLRFMWYSLMFSECQEIQPYAPLSFSPCS